jgi:tetrahydromethanopterin S-methyltransferase subunit G
MPSSQELISEELRFVNLKLDQLSDLVEDIDKNTSKLKEALYHPDDGLYIRTRDNDKSIQDLGGKLSSHEEKEKKLHEDIEKITKAMEPIVDDYKIRQSRKVWTDKIVGIILAIILGLMVPTIYKVFISQQNDTIEQKDKK